MALCEFGDVACAHRLALETAVAAREAAFPFPRFPIPQGLASPIPAGLARPQVSALRNLIDGRRPPYTSEHDPELFITIIAAAPIKCAREAFTSYARALFSLGLDVLHGIVRPSDALLLTTQDFVSEVSACPVDCEGAEALPFDCSDDGAPGRIHEAVQATLEAVSVPVFDEDDLVLPDLSYPDLGDILLRAAGTVVAYETAILWGEFNRLLVRSLPEFIESRRAWISKWGDFSPRVLDAATAEFLDRPPLTGPMPRFGFALQPECCTRTEVLAALFQRLGAQKGPYGPNGA